VSVSIAVISW